MPLHVWELRMGMWPHLCLNLQKHISGRFSRLLFFCQLPLLELEISVWAGHTQAVNLQPNALFIHQVSLVCAAYITFRRKRKSKIIGSTVSNFYNSVEFHMQKKDNRESTWVHGWDSFCYCILWKTQSGRRSPLTCIYATYALFLTFSSFTPLAREQQISAEDETGIPE